MSRRTPRSNLTVSLFPFLAVLVCAMGALIFLLIVTTQMIGDETAQKLAIKTVAPDPEPEPELEPPPRPSPFIEVDPYELPNPEDLEAAPEFVVVVPELEPEPEPIVAVAPPPDPNIELRRQIAALKVEQNRRRTKLAEQTADLRKAENELAAAQNALKRQQAALEELRAEEQQLRSEDEEFQAERRKLLLNIRKAEQHLDELQKRRANAPSKYALIPYDGRQGTTRRPIFVECTDKGIRFLPENVFLGPQQLEGFTESFNPMLLGVQALHDYWSQKAKVAGTERTEKPYLLLVVRPEGSVTYYMARKFLAEWKESYGYELIEEDFDWQLPPADPEAQMVLRRAIAEALKSRSDVVRKFAVRGSIDDLTRFPDEAELADEDLPFAHGSSTASRFAAKARQHRRRIAERGTAKGSGRRGTGDGEQGQTSLPGWDPIPTQRRGGGTGTYSSQENRAPHGIAANPFENAGQSTDIPRRFVKPSDAAMLNPGRNLANGGENRRGNQGESPKADSLFQDGSDGPLMPPDDANSAFGDEQNPGDGLLAGRDPRGGETGVDEAQPGRTGDAGSSAQSRGSEADRSDGQPARGRSGENAAPTPNDIAKTPFTGRTTLTPAQTAASPSPHAPQAGGTSSPAAIGEQNPPAMPQLSITRQQEMDRMKRNLAKRGWGLSRRSGIGIERSVNVVITPDRIQIGDLDTAIVLGYGETQQQLLRAVIVDIDENAKKWGTPPSGFYWVPSVKFHVHPKAVTVLKPIETALREGGLSTSTDYLQADADTRVKQEVTR